MKKRISEINVGENSKRVRIRIESQECPDALQARKELSYLLETLANQPDMLYCDLQLFDKCTIYHDGKIWIVEAEKIVEKTDKGD